MPAARTLARVSPYARSASGTRARIASASSTGLILAIRAKRSDKRRLRQTIAKHGSMRNNAAAETARKREPVQYTKAEAKTAARETFTGIWAAVTTPFDAMGRIDHRALATDLRYLIDSLEVGGVFCTGVMGEFWALTHRERIEAIRTVIETCGGDVPVLAHTGHHSARETIELTRE